MAFVVVMWATAERDAARQELVETRTEVGERLNHIGGRLGQTIRADIRAANGLATLFALFPKLDNATFERAAVQVLAESPALRHIAVAPDLVVNLIVPLTGNEKAIGLDYRKTPSQFDGAESARRSRQTVLSGPLQLVQGGQGLIARVPIFVTDTRGGERFWGLLSAVIDVAKLYEGAGLLDPKLPIDVAIRGRGETGSGGEVFFGRAALFNEEPILDTVQFPQGSWQIAAVPRGGWPTQASNAWALRAGYGSTLLVILAALYLLMRAMRVATRAHTQAHLAERRVSAIADNMPALIAQVDSDGRFVFANATFQEWLGLNPKDMVGQRAVDLLDDGFRNHIPEVMRLGERMTREEQVDKRLLSMTYVPEIGDDRRVEGVFMLGLDVTSLKAVEARLQRLARFDHLTGLLNRRSFEEELGSALARARRSKASLGLMFLDIDHFKAINDGRGHASGDAVLQEFAKRLLDTVRSTDTVARLGGDEFVVILEPLLDGSSAGTIAQKIAATMAEPMDIPGGSLLVTTSMGVGVTDQLDIATVELLLATADAALYAAKNAGRNTFRVRRLSESASS